MKNKSVVGTILLWVLVVLVIRALLFIVPVMINKMTPGM